MGEITQSGEIGGHSGIECRTASSICGDSQQFFDKSSYGGILTDIGSHQVEQF